MERTPARTVLPSPVEIAARLSGRVVGQRSAVREMSVALAKKLTGASTGNILLIGSSGSGKTTLMRAVEELLADLPACARRWSGCMPTCSVSSPKGDDPERRWSRR
jgi:ATP-dependent protease Clp ATPase subunit